LATFSRPGSLALDAASGTLAVGTLGDDALYFFQVAPSGDPEFAYSVPKEAFAGLASLSDPVALAFGPGGTSLYVLSYYGKALIRLDRNAESGRYVPAWAAKSGSLGISGFDYPKRMAISPDGAFLAVSGSGSADGLTLFDIRSPGNPMYRGTVRVGDGEGGVRKPYAVAFDAAGTALAVGSSEEKKLVFFVR
jgi:DNA-binding beta-propeller fold protein YncE